MNSFADVWASVLSQLKNDLSETTFSAWFDELEAVDMQGTTFVLYCPNAFKKDFIEKLYIGNIQAALRNLFSMDLKSKFWIKRNTAL